MAIFDGEGRDNTIFGTDQADTINGKGGNDSLIGDAGDDRVRGGQGNDTVAGSLGDDHLIGDAGDDDLFGGALDLPGPGDDDLLAEAPATIASSARQAAIACWAAPATTSWPAGRRSTS